jgi:hypothetical protein
VGDDIVQCFDLPVPSSHDKFAAGCRKPLNGNNQSQLQK